MIAILSELVFLIHSGRISFAMYYDRVKKKKETGAMRYVARRREVVEGAIVGSRLRVIPYHNRNAN